MPVRWGHALLSSFTGSPHAPPVLCQGAFARFPCPFPSWPTSHHIPSHLWKGITGLHIRS